MILRRWSAPSLFMVIALLAALVLVLPGTPARGAATPVARSDRQQVTFTSEGTRIVGYHYRAAGTGPRPVLVMALGFGAVQSAILPTVAPRFTAAGYDVLTFDYRHWGESDGSPRNLLDVPSQLADWRSAIRAARTLPGVDPTAVGIWGTSLAGGHVLQIGSENLGLRAVISQAPHVNGFASVATIPFGTLLQLANLGIQDLWAGLTGAAPVYVPIAGEPGSLATLPQPGSLAGYRDVTGADFDNRVAARIGLQIPFYSPDSAAPKSKSPTFIAVELADGLTPAGPARDLAVRMKATLRTYPNGHFDVYPGRPDYEQILAAELEFLRQHMPTPLG